MNFKDLKKSEIYFLVILALIHIVFLVYAIYYGNIYIGDFRDYLHQAINIKDHANWYSGEYSEPLDINLYSKRPPLYGFFIYLIKAIYPSDYFVLAVQSCLSFLNFCGLLSMLKKYEFKTNTFVLILLFIIFYPSQLIYANFIMSEMLFQTFLFWAFYNFVEYVQRRESINIFYYNLFLTFALLTKPVLYLFWIINLIFMIYFFLKNKKIYSPVYYGLIPLAAIMIISIYNYRVTGYFHFNSLKHNNLFDLNSRFLLINNLGYEKANKIYLEDSLRISKIKDYSEQSKEKEKVALSVIKDNLGDYVKFHLKGMLIFFMDPGRFDIAEFFGNKNMTVQNEGIYDVYLSEGFIGIFNYILRLPFLFVFYLILIFVINIIMICSIINFIFEKRVEPEIRLFFILIIGYICLLSGNIGALRYKIPLLQIILFSIPFFFESIRTYRLNKSLRVTENLTSIK